MRYLHLALVTAAFAASTVQAQPFVEETFDSYSAAGSFNANGGTGWASDVPTAVGTSVTPGLTGSGKSMFEPNYSRTIDLSSPELDPLLVDPINNRVFGGAGVVVWTSFYMRTADTADVGAFNSPISFDSNVNFATSFDNGFNSNQLTVNGGSGNVAQIASSDLSTTTHIVAKWSYTAEDQGVIEIWLNPTATTEAELGAPDGSTPQNPGFIRSFDRVDFPSFGSNLEVDEFLIGDAYEDFAGVIFADGFESGNTSNWSSATP